MRHHIIASQVANYLIFSFLTWDWLWFMALGKTGLYERLHFVVIWVLFSVVTFLLSKFLERYSE